MKASIKAFLVDFGGTHTKWAFSNGFKVLDSGQFESVPVVIKSNGRATIDPDLFASHVIELRTHLGKLFGTPTDIAFTGQMASYSLVDRKGSFLSPIISWQDFSPLTADASSKWSFENSKARLEESAHNLFDGFRPGLPLANLPLVASDYGIVLKDSYFKSMLSVASDVWQFEAVQTNSVMHATDAAASGFFNPINGLWNYSLLEAQSIDQINLPNVIESFQPHPAVLQDGIRYWPAIGDQQAAIFGCEVEPHELFIHVATGAQVAEISNIDFAHSAFVAGGRFQIRPYVQTGKVVATSTHLPAGRLLDRAMSFNQKQALTFDLVNEIDLKDSEDDIKFQFRFDSKGSFSLGNLTLSNFNASNVVKALLIGIPNTLINAAAELPTETFRKAVLSGGVLMRQPGLRDKLKELLPSLQIRDQIAEDTSIVGLNRLLQDNLHSLETMIEE